MYNGNFTPEMGDVPKNLKNFVAEGGDERGNYIKNISSEIIVLKGGYKTTSNGWADDLSLNPGERIYKSSKGNASAFSTYEVYAENE